MKKLYCLIVLYLCFGGLGDAYAQNISNEGSEFWLAFATHDPSGNQEQNKAVMNVNVTSKVDSRVRVRCGTYDHTADIPANTVVTFPVPRSDSYIPFTDANQTLSNKGIHVTVVDGKPNVSVYSHVYANARSAAALILPVKASGQKYYSMNYTQDVSTSGEGFPARNFLLLVATEDDTKLLIHTKNQGIIPVLLNKAGDVYEYMPNGTTDLTGTLVEVDQAPNYKCKKFAAFSGSTSMVIGTGCGTSRDPLFQQLYPVNSWGKSYGVVPFIDRRYIVRVVAQEDDTKVNVGGTVVTVNKGAYYEHPIAINPMIISADKLISVAQYSLTQGCSSVNGGNIQGDPEMLLLNPTEFNISKVTLFTSGKNDIKVRYLNVFMKTDQTSSFKINGQVPDNGTWLPMPADLSYSYIQIAVAVGADKEDISYTLTADEGFNAIAYGFGNAESYAYSAGTNLASTQFLGLFNKFTNQEIKSVCVGQEVEFKVTLPYRLSKIIWDFSDGFSETEEMPIYVEKPGNPTLYTYQLKKTRTLNDLGPITLDISGDVFVGAESCDRTGFEFNFELDVVPLPIAKIDPLSLVCMGDVVSFNDVSDPVGVGKRIVKRIWDFDDPASGTSNYSTEPTPTHVFATLGLHKVKLMVTTEDGCQSDFTILNVIINPKPAAKFKPNFIKTCLTTAVQFADLSTVETGAIVKWTWDFGDPNSTDNSSTLQNSQHSYAVPGTYDVTLTVETDQGCITTSAPTTIEITGPIKSDFNAPDVCIDDPVTVFENLSLNSDGTINGLTYEWNFGDPLSPPADNTSFLRIGQHSYQKEGNYTVTLTVRNSEGCVDVLQKAFTVNGANPKAEFEIINKDKLCSNTTFTVKDKSAVSFGRITRLVWTINNVDHIIEDPEAQAEYSFSLPASTVDVPVNIKLISFSGIRCISPQVEDNFTLHASPIIKFDALADICINSGNRQLIASQVSTLLGTARFSGSGVSPLGVFNPAIAGLGTHDITYNFTTTEGCSASIVQTITVNPVPGVDAGQDFYMLAGELKALDATATGSGLEYKWSPAAGLSADNVLNPMASPEKDTEYTLTVTTKDGCMRSDRIFVHVLQPITIPSSFSPNGDNINDTWDIRYLDTYPNATVEVFTRNGTKVYSSLGYRVPFDGNFQNQALPVGVYYYIVNPKNGRKVVTGSVTLIR